MIIYREVINDTLVISTMSRKGKIDVNKVNMQGQKRRWVVCDENDPMRDKTKRNWDGKPVKQINVYNMKKDMRTTDIREYMLHRADEDLKQKMFAYVPIDGVSCDIEVDMRGVESFPYPKDALYPVISISFTMPSMDTIMFTTRPHDRIDLSNEKDNDLNKRITDKINDYMKDCNHAYDFTKHYTFKHIVFDSEADMLAEFIRMCRKHIDVMFGWNFVGFDWAYIKKRCEILTVQTNRMDLNLDHICPNYFDSPKNRIDYKTGIPKHKLIFDYKEVFEEYKDIKNLNNLKLDTVAERILGVKKVDFDGSYGDFIEKDYENFLLYGAIDTILVQLIHKVKRYTSSIEMLANMSKIGITDVRHETNIGNAHIFDGMWEDNMVYGDVDKPLPEKVDYKGGFVKQPIEYKVLWLIGRDFKALYPSLGRATGMSFENQLGKVKTKAEYFELVKNKNIFISANGTIYDISKRAIMPKLWDKFTYERDYYKGLMKELATKIQPTIKEELIRRGLL